MRIRTKKLQEAEKPESREDPYYAIRRWWVDKYKLPPNHELFLDRPPAFWLEEMFEDYAEERQGLIEISDRDNIDQTRVTEIRDNLEVALGLKKKGQFSNDPVIEKWERALMETGAFPEDFYENVDPRILKGKRGREMEEHAKAKPLSHKYGKSGKR